MLALLILPRPLWFSNAAQVVLPLIAFLFCVSRWRTERERSVRMAWFWLTFAFSIWIVAELAYLAELYLIPKSYGILWPDDVLWMLFALPILVVTTEPFKGQTNWINLLDHGQAFVYFGILLASVYCTPHALPFNTAYNFQNLTVLLSCLLRISSIESKRAVRFYVDLALYLLVYLICAGVGNFLQSLGMAPGSLVDVLWCLPITTFCFLAWRSDLVETADENRAPWSKSLARLTQGVSALGLALVSIGASAAVIFKHPVLGSISLVGSFGLFAVRTIVREVQSHRSSDLLHDSSMRDPLTGLGNRVRFRLDVQGLAATRAFTNTKLALIFVDLDRFKEINDELGHLAGDSVLVEIARRLQQASRKEDSVCRLGGDEFVVALALSDENVALTRAEALRIAIAEPFSAGGRTLNITASIGVVLGDLSEEVEGLLRRADDAMYRAKKYGKNQVQMFDHDSEERVRVEWTLEHELQKCLEEGGIQVAYQPIYSANQSSIVGCEALARWFHPERGPVPPNLFIPLAEKAGLIHTLGSQVMATACRQMAEWNRTLRESLFVSVNVSATQLSESNLLAGIQQILVDSGLPAELLHLEITESILLMENALVDRFLTEARALGISISLDDFGTGYSSLSHLLDLPVDEIKIDRRFIHNLHGDSRQVEVVRAILTLGKALGKRVVAEGVESQHQVKFLRQLNCDFLQGYVISEPLTPDLLEELLRSGLSWQSSQPGLWAARTAG